ASSILYVKPLNWLLSGFNFQLPTKESSAARALALIRLSSARNTGIGGRIDVVISRICEWSGLVREEKNRAVNVGRILRLRYLPKRLRGQTAVWAPNVEIILGLKMRRRKRLLTEKKEEDTCMIETLGEIPRSGSCRTSLGKTCQEGGA